MTAILVSSAVSLLVALLGTPALIKFLERRHYGQFIRDDGPEGHFIKRGTPTMGGLVIIIALVLGYAAANLVELRTPRASGILLLFLIVGLGLIGFLDDFEKISRQRSLGLTPWQKMLGQAVIGIGFSVAGLLFADRNGLTPASTRISFARDSLIDTGGPGRLQQRPLPRVRGPAGHRLEEAVVGRRRTHGVEDGLHPAVGARRARPAAEGLDAEGGVGAGGAGALARVLGARCGGGE